MTLTGIAAAAVAIADRDGLTGVTMRSVAAALGTSAAGLYRYVASREELVAHMVDLVSADVRHRRPTGDWVGDLVDVAESQRGVFRTHPWLAGALDGALVLGPNVLDHLEWGLAVLEGVVAPPGQKMEALAVTNGIAALFASAGTVGGPEAFAQLDARRHARVLAVLGAATSGSPTPDLFPRVLEAVLRAILSTSPRSGPRDRSGRQDG
jgi:AcrR family transcriptional regulator